MKVKVPPIKSQGIKTKLVPWIGNVVPEEFEGCWIEPFMGTGVVGFNIAPKHAIMCDSNPHLINFYNAVKTGEITSEIVRKYLNDTGSLLLKKGGEHYYALRNKFNENHQPLDFLFVNRSGFNGMIRFNRNGGFNTPFCKKPNRYAQAYITKIANQVDYVSQLLKVKDFTFKCQSFEDTIKAASSDDIIYCDPPYIGRHVDYYNGWDSEHEQTLFDSLCASDARFILSTWHHNDFRENDYIKTLWNRFNIHTREHFYHVGGREKNRNPMTEAIVTNYDVPDIHEPEQSEQIQLTSLA